MSQAPLSYQHSVDLLQAYNIPLAGAFLASNPDEAAEAAQEIGFPVALKLVAPGFSHKSDAGLVKLNLQDFQAVRQAAAELDRKAGEAPSSEVIEGYLVQEMVSGGVELIVGSSTDVQFGPVLLLGAGGIWVELLDDIALRLPPLTDQQAHAMVEEIRVGTLLYGYRGQPPADLPALRRLLVQVGKMAVEQAQWLDSLDLNPVIVLPEGQGLKVVDYRIVPR